MLSSLGSLHCLYFLPVLFYGLFPSTASVCSWSGLSIFPCSVVALFPLNLFYHLTYLLHLLLLSRYLSIKCPSVLPSVSAFTVILSRFHGYLHARFPLPPRPAFDK